MPMLQLVSLTWSKAEVALQLCLWTHMDYYRRYFGIEVPLKAIFVMYSFWKVLHFKDPFRDPWKCLLSSHYTVRMKERLWKVKVTPLTWKTINNFQFFWQFCQTEFTVFKLALCCTSGTLVVILFNGNLWALFSDPKRDSLPKN